jgi:hypothetical protein
LETIKYRFYPSLLNLFERYQAGKLEFEDFIARINRVPIPSTEAQARGIAFENAVIKGIDEDLYDYLILQKVRALLPRPMMKTQVYCEHQLGEVMFYGYVDVIGKTLAADIKTTSLYVPDCFAKSHQNLYLPALRQKGIRSLRYIITDFREVYQEDYDQTVDMSYQEEQIKLFGDFLEEHRKRVTDKRIFCS